MRQVWFAIALSAGMISMTGCGPSNDCVPVSGKVYLDDKPVANVMVTFQPRAISGVDAGGVGSYATTDAEGRYTLEAMTEKPRSGAFVGKHQVRIATPPPKGESESDAVNAGKKRFRDPIPAKYNVESSLFFEVPAGGSQQADFRLTSN